MAHVVTRCRNPEEALELLLVEERKLRRENEQLRLEKAYAEAQIRSLQETIQYSLGDFARHPWTPTALTSARRYLAQKVKQTKLDRPISRDITSILSSLPPAPAATTTTASPAATSASALFTSTSSITAAAITTTTATASITSASATTSAAGTKLRRASGMGLPHGDCHCHA